MAPDIGFSRFGVGVRNGAPRRVHEVGLPRHLVGPRGRVGILKVGHEDRGARVEGLGGGGEGGDLPVALAHPRRLGQEVRARAGVERGLHAGAAGEELVDAGGVGAGEVGDKGDGLSLTSLRNCFVRLRVLSLAR